MRVPHIMGRDRHRAWVWGVPCLLLLASCQSSGPVVRARPVAGPGGGAAVVARPLPGGDLPNLDVDGTSGYAILFNPGSIERQIDLKEERAQRAQEIQQQLENQSGDFRGYVTELEEEKTRRQQQIGELSGKIDQLSQQIGRITTERTDLTSQFNRVDGRRKALQKELEYLADPSQSGVAGAARENRMAVLRDEIDKLEEEVVGLEQEYTILNPEE